LEFSPDSPCNSLTLFAPGEVKVDLATLTSNWGKTFDVLYFKKYLFLQKHLVNMFLLDTQHQNDVLTLFLMIQHQNSGHCAAQQPCHLLLGLIANLDHLRAGKVLTGCGLQFSTAPIRIPISFWSLAVQSAGDGRFSVGSTMSLFQVD
jgi:hypothetical protein